MNGRKNNITFCWRWGKKEKGNDAMVFRLNSETSTQVGSILVLLILVVVVPGISEIPELLIPIDS